MITAGQPLTFDDIAASIARRRMHWKVPCTRCGAFLRVDRVGAEKCEPCELAEENGGGGELTANRC